MSMPKLPAAVPAGIEKSVTVSEPVSAQEMGVIAGLIFRNFITGETINVMPVTYSELRRLTQQDGQAKGLLRLLTMPIMSAKWDILTAEEDLELSSGKTTQKVIASKMSENASPERDLIYQNLFMSVSDGGMSIPFSEIVGTMALAVRDGFKVFEKVFTLNDRGRVVLKKLAYRENDTVSLLVDDHGDFDGFRQQCYFSGRFVDVTIDKDKALLYSFAKADGGIYGAPLFLPVYYHLDKKHKLYYISHVAYQMLAIPPRIGKFPSGADDAVKKKFLKDLATLGFNSAMTIPDSFSIESFESRRHMADFIPLIDHHNQMAAKAILGQFMDLTKSATGKLAGEQEDVFVLSIVSILKDIEKLFNNWIIPQIVDFNFASRKYPKLRARAFTDTEQEAIAATFKEVVGATTLNCSPEFMVELEKKMAGQLDIKNIDYDMVEKRAVEEHDQDRKLAEVAATKPAFGGEPDSPGGPKGRPKGGDGGDSGGKEGNE